MAEQMQQLTNDDLLDVINLDEKLFGEEVYFGLLEVKRRGFSTRIVDGRLILC